MCTPIAGLTFIRNTAITYKKFIQKIYIEMVTWMLKNWFSMPLNP
jgi:hypothetical protein